ncbi:MAG: hypothetical protein A2W00_02080 [Candidatus Eisenbacteria bacterium RBG_16_71_46]|nr:MAG: hypothetical protein A2W00_02080 [Candidatus Eisenbacteria bacterium RBG_16_71_46]
MRIPIIATDLGTGAARRWTIALLLAAVAVAGWLALRPRGERPARAPGSRAQVPGMPDSIAALDPVEAARRVAPLVRAKRWSESLPYFRCIVAERTAGALAHSDYATVLHNASVEAHPRAGLLVPLTRSSVERVAMLREALRQYDLALSLATGPQERAFILGGRGNILRGWGFPWEALADYRRAADLDSSWRGHASYYDSLVRDPARQPR